jgi:light-regulated signal transduction histidine kinase (bacteriophytochrome)
MPHSTLSILIADDDEGDRRQIRRALKQAGLSCECVEAASIEEALEACREHAFDCAFVDYRMPGHDGLHGMTSLHERLPDLPIIMATGQGDEMVATEAMKRGASDYIPKMHVHAASLRRIVENALEVAALRRKLAQQQQELENFAAVLVHDLRAPIASIRAFAHYIEEALRSETADKKAAIEHCRRVVAAGARMGTLIDTLYEYTRADARVPFEPVELRRAMEVTLFNLTHTIRERQAQVTHGELPAVIGNFAQLVQLLQNLIGNSIKYCEAACPAARVTASTDRDGTWLIAVRDNGIGIPQAHYQDIFEPFKRLHDRAKFEGTGLGLATCKKIVERHGGIIRCESREGDGTTFFFTLKAAQGVA